MGNSLPLPYTCKETAAVTPAALGAGAKKTRRPRKKRAAADKNAAIVPVDTPDDWDEKKAEDDGVLVKVVMTRKEAAELMARIHEEERAGDAAERESAGVMGGSLANVPCRVDCWRPRLATIPENYCRY